METAPRRWAAPAALSSAVAVAIGVAAAAKWVLRRRRPRQAASGSKACSDALQTQRARFIQDEDEVPASRGGGLIEESEGHYTQVLGGHWGSTAPGRRASHDHLHSCLARGLAVVRKALSEFDAIRQDPTKSCARSLGRAHVCKVERLLVEVQEQVVASPELWFLGRDARVQEFCARVGSLHSPLGKWQLWRRGVHVSAAQEVYMAAAGGSGSEASAPPLEVWAELRAALPSLEPLIGAFLGLDLAPEERLLQDELSFTSLQLCLEQLVADPYDDPLDQDSHYANSVTQDTRRKN